MSATSNGGPAPSPTLARRGQHEANRARWQAHVWTERRRGNPRFVGVGTDPNLVKFGLEVPAEDDPNPPTWYLWYHCCTDCRTAALLAAETAIEFCPACGASWACEHRR